MKKLPLFLFIAAIALIVYLLAFWKGGSIKIPLESKTKTSDTVASSHKGLPDFDKIEIDGVFEVDVTYGSEEKVEIEAPRHIKKRIKMKVKSNTLSFELTNNGSIYTAGKVKVHVTTAKLNSFDLSGASSIRLNNSLVDDYFILNSSGATNFSGEVMVQNADIFMGGAAKTNISGKAYSAKMELSGACKLSDYDFEVAELEVDLSGASAVRISGIKEINGSLSGASSLDYEGKPVIKLLEVSGASHVTQH